MTIDIGDTVKFTTAQPGGFSSTEAAPLVHVDNIELGSDGHKVLWVSNVPAK